MKSFFLKIHDLLMHHRRVAFVVLVLLVVAQIIAALGIGFQENVTDFLPEDEENARYMSVYESIGGQGTVTLVFEAEGDEADERRATVAEAVETFERVCDSLATAKGEAMVLRCHVDETVAMDAMAYMRENVALFLDDGDYERIDSLLAIEGYVDSCLRRVRSLMALPMGQMAMTAVASDPLNLFSPSLRRLEWLGPSDAFTIDEDVLFDSSNRGYAFVDSPYEGSDTKGNVRIVNILNCAIKATLEQVPNVSILSVGAPVIAVGNASQIKRDSIVAMAISVVLIAAILLIALRRKRDILLLVVSVAAGWLFALAAVALLSTTVSIIVIGIGSVLVGIAVNYPLHFLEHFENHPNRREALKEMVEPLVTGNITTVSAFACLIFMDSDAMRDLGLFGAMMLVGTILFVMVVLPLMVKERVSDFNAATESVEPAGGAEATGGSHRGPWLSMPLFAVVVGLTIWLGIRSMNPSFDSDLHNINYMTEEQQRGLTLLNSLLGDTAHRVEYVVSTGATADEALQLQERFWESGGKDHLAVKGAVGVIPSMSSQRRSVEKWNAMLAKHPTLAGEVRRKAVGYGFTEQAFSAFFGALDRHYDVVDPAEMDPLVAMTSSYLLSAGDTHAACLVSMVDVPADSSVAYKSMLRECAPDDASLFVFDIDDVGNNLVKDLNFDFNYILYICGFVVFFFLWLSFGRIELALLSFLPLAVAWLWILGIMDLASVKFNIVNIILATFIFGQGDDYTIFITEGLIYENAYGRRRLKGYRRSVIISALLMFAGIGSLIIAKHPAMRSLAEVAIIGMAVVVMMACYLPPLVFRWLVERRGVHRDVPLTLGRLANFLFILLIFILFALVIITPYTFVYRLVGRDSDSKRLRFHRMVQRFLGFGIRHIPGVGFRYSNPEGETFDKPAVIVANHQSHLDLLCVLQMTPNVVILTNNRVWHNPIYGAIIRYAEFFPVHDGYDVLVPRLKALVERGYSVVVFPEGTRSVDGEIGRFHKGAFSLAQQLGLDLLPVMIHGANHVMPKKDKVIRKGTLTVEVKKRIPYGGFASKDTRLLTNEMRELMKAYLEDMRDRIEDESYCLPFVRYQYMYKGREVARRARRNLEGYLNNGTFVTGQGEVALLKALAHRKEQFEYVFDDSEDYAVLKTIVERLGVKNITLTLKK